MCLTPNLTGFPVGVALHYYILGFKQPEDQVVLKLY